MIRLAMVAALAVGPALPLRANDSVAGLALGGLQFLRSDTIRMVEEDLHITPREVRVLYVFRNEGTKPVDTIVAFPLPAVGFPYEMDYLPIPFEDSENYVGFSTRVDGVEIALNVESRAMQLGVDRTARLRELGVPLVPFAYEAQQRIEALPAETRRALRDELLIGPGNEPLWLLETSFWRRQSFPPGVDVVVEHRYLPVSGGSASAPVGNAEPDFAEGDGWAADSRRRYCIEPEVEIEANRRRQVGAGPDARHFGASDLGYVLTTGANWRGPIGRFRLTVEAPNPADFVFVCLDGARRVAGNRIEAELTDFWPWHDLEILFLHMWGDGIVRDDF